jgi:hypothetical protein
MFDVKEAVKIAVSYMKDLYQPEEIPNLLLEEAELSEDSKYWLVTLGFTRELVKASPFAIALTNEPIREIRAYKVIKINIEDRRVEAMQIRKL